MLHTRSQQQEAGEITLKIRQVADRALVENFGDIGAVGFQRGCLRGHSYGLGGVGSFQLYVHLLRRVGMNVERLALGV